MIAQTQMLTAEDLARLPDDGSRYELIKGVLHKMPPPGFRHSKLANRFASRLTTYVEAHNLGVVCGEGGWILARNPDTVRAPDASFIRQERITPENEDEVGYPVGAPDLVAEVISPSDTYSEVADKVQTWLAGGTHMVVVIDPRKRQITVYQPDT